MARFVRGRNASLAFASRRATSRDSIRTFFHIFRAAIWSSGESSIRSLDVASIGERRRASTSVDEHRRASSSVVEHRRASSSIVEHRRASSSIVERRRASSSIVEHRRTQLLRCLRRLRRLRDRRLTYRETRVTVMTAAMTLFECWRRSHSV